MPGRGLKWRLLGSVIVLILVLLLCTVIAKRADILIFVGAKSYDYKLIIAAVERGGEQMLPKLAPYLASPDPRERETVVIALPWVKAGEAAVPLLIVALDDPNRRVRYSAMHALMAISIDTDVKQAIPKLKAFIESPDEPRLEDALQVIGQLGTSARRMRRTLERTSADIPR